MEVLPYLILSAVLALVSVMLFWRVYKIKKISRQECDILQEQLKRAYKMEAAGRLAGSVAHDFNNMLAGICGAAECLDAKLKDNPELKKYSEIIMNSCEQASQLTSQLMMFSKQKEQKTEIIDLTECVDNSLNLLRHGISKNIEVVRALCSRKLPVQISCEQVQSIILNLGFNARDAMNGKGQITVKLRKVELLEEDFKGKVLKASPGEYAEIEFADNGPGIAPEIMDKIFEPFFTTKGVNKGTGLGLPAIYGSVGAAGGSIGVENREKGAVFHLYFPLAPQIAVRGSENEQPEPLNARVLVADDEPLLRELMADILRQAGAEAVTADGAESVMKLFREKGPFDVVMLDVIMPGYYGTDIYKKLKTADKRLKTVFMSGYTQDEEVEKILRSDRYTAFLHKPYRAAEVVKTVQILLAKAQEA